MRTFLLYIFQNYLFQCINQLPIKLRIPKCHKQTCRINYTEHDLILNVSWIRSPRCERAHCVGNFLTNQQRRYHTNTRTDDVVRTIRSGLGSVQTLYVSSYRRAFQTGRCLGIVLIVKTTILDYLSSTSFLLPHEEQLQVTSNTTATA